jgi:hypothetical protein
MAASESKSIQGVQQRALHEKTIYSINQDYP